MATLVWGPRFVATIHAYRPGLRLDGADQAFDAGMRYLDDRHRQPLHTVAEEQERFTDFYRIVLERLGIHDPPPALLQRLVEGGDDEVAMEAVPRSRWRPAALARPRTTPWRAHRELAVGRDRLPPPRPAAAV
jgi:hypothetical protein